MVTGVSFAEAAAQALHEVDVVGDDDGIVEDSTSVSPSGEDGSQASGVDQPSAEGVFSDLEDVEPNQNPGDQDNLVEVPGHGKLPLDEVIAGYMKDADYRQKTSEVAELRRKLEDAERLVDSLRENPHQTIMGLADSFGVKLERERSSRLWSEVERLGTPKGEQKKGDDFTNSELDALTIQAQIKEAVKEALGSVPELEELRQQRALDKVNRQFASLEERHNVRFTNEDKRLMLQKARELGGSLDAAFLVLSNEKDEVQKRRQQLREAGTVKGSASDIAISVDDDPVEVKSFADAVRAALVETGMSL